MNIGGKDFLTTDEAAHFCCASTRQFYKFRDELGIRPLTFMGKKVYKKDDLKDAIEREFIVPTL